MSKSKPTVIVLDIRLITSRAWLSLTGAAPLVYLLFRPKCQMQRVRAPGKPGKRSEHLVITNNGQLEFTYVEARDRYGISQRRFLEAIEQLVRYGFLDITRVGGGLFRNKTLYAISDRWKDYGTPDFQTAERPASAIKTRGRFPRGNHLGRNARTAEAEPVCSISNNGASEA